jgi:hypothetical protein
MRYDAIGTAILIGGNKRLQRVDGQQVMAAGSHGNVRWGGYRPPPRSLAIVNVGEGWMDVFSSPWEQEAKEMLRRVDAYIRSLSDDYENASKIPDVKVAVSSLTWGPTNSDWAFPDIKMPINPGGLYYVVKTSPKQFPSDNITVTFRFTGEAYPNQTKIEPGQIIGKGATIGPLGTVFATVLDDFKQPASKGIIDKTTKDSLYYQFSKFYKEWLDFLTKWEGAGWNSFQASTVRDNAKQYRDRAQEFADKLKALGGAVSIQSAPPDPAKPPPILPGLDGVLTIVGVLAGGALLYMVVKK